MKLDGGEIYGCKPEDYDLFHAAIFAVAGEHTILDRRCSRLGEAASELVIDGLISIRDGEDLAVDGVSKEVAAAALDELAGFPASTLDPRVLAA